MGWDLAGSAADGVGSGGICRRRGGIWRDPSSHLSVPTREGSVLPNATTSEGPPDGLITGTNETKYRSVAGTGVAL